MHAMDFTKKNKYCDKYSWPHLNISNLKGCVGALRENTALLAGYAIFLAIILLIEMTCGILGYIFKVSFSIFN